MVLVDPEGKAGMNGSPDLRVYTCPGCGRIVCYERGPLPNVSEEIECGTPGCGRKRFSSSRDQPLAELMDEARKWKERHP